MKLEHAIKVTGLPAKFDEQQILQLLNGGDVIVDHKKLPGVLVIEFKSSGDREAAWMYDEFDLTLDDKQYVMKIEELTPDDVLKLNESTNAADSLNFNLKSGEIKGEEASRIIHVSGLPPNMSDDMSNQLLSKFGGSKVVEKTYQGKGEYLVQFFKESEAINSMIYDGSEIAQGYTMKIAPFTKTDASKFNITLEDDWVRVDSKENSDEGKKEKERKEKADKEAKEREEQEEAENRKREAEKRDRDERERKEKEEKERKDREAREAREKEEKERREREDAERKRKEKEANEQRERQEAEEKLKREEAIRKQEEEADRLERDKQANKDTTADSIEQSTVFVSQSSHSPQHTVTTHQESEPIVKDRTQNKPQPAPTSHVSTPVQESQNSFQQLLTVHDSKDVYRLCTLTAMIIFFIICTYHALT